MPASEPLDHVLRGNLPWRDDYMTECGRPANDVGSHIEVDELKQRIKEWGKQRTAMTVCMTCWNTAAQHARWDESPVSVMNRETARAGAHYGPYNRTNPEWIQLTKELRAVAALVEAHREEFDQYVNDLGQVTHLAARRKAR